MFIITHQPTIEWIEKMYGFYKANPNDFNSKLSTLANYINMQKGQPLAFNEFLAVIGLHVITEFIYAQQNPITLNDNCDPNSPNQVGSDPGPSVQP